MGLIHRSAILVIVLLLCGCGDSPPPPTSPLKDIKQIVHFKNARGDDFPYELVSIDPVTKQVVTRRRWFDNVVLDAKPDELPWAEVQTRDRSGKGNVLHVHSLDEIVVRVEGQVEKIK